MVDVVVQRRRPLRLVPWNRAPHLGTLGSVPTGTGPALGLHSAMRIGFEIRSYTVSAGVRSTASSPSSDQLRHQIGEGTLVVFRRRSSERDLEPCQVRCVVDAAEVPLRFTLGT